LKLRSIWNGTHEAAGYSEATRAIPAAKKSKWLKRLAPWAGIILLGVTTFVLRAVRLSVSWDIFVDEISYLRISQSVAQHLEVNLYGNTFYLHPPAFFFLQGAYVKLFPPAGDLIHQIYDVRYLNAALATLTAIVLLGIGRRLAGWPAGIAAAGIFALEPYIIKMNSRNYLDTSAMLWMALGYYVLFSAITEEKRRLPLWRPLTAGFLFGLGLLTKDMVAFSTMLPLAVCFVTGWALTRLQSTLVGMTALLTYLPYPIIVYAIGDWRDFSYQKFRGASRLAGFIHETGFNQEGGPSFLDAILANLREFVTTYAFLATGSLSVLVLFFFFGGAARRLLLAWTASTYALLAYIVVLGTLEEQFFYFLIVPSILATTVTATLVIKAEMLHIRVRRALLSVMASLAVAFLIWTGYVWVQIHLTPDNSYERVADYLRGVPEEYNVGVSNDTTQFVMRDLVVNDTLYDTTEQLRVDNVDYVVISSKLVEQGYGPSPEYYRWVKSHGKLVYGFVGRSFGLMGVYRLPEHQEVHIRQPSEAEVHIRQPSEARYISDVGDIQRRSVEADLESGRILRGYDAITADDVDKMEAYRASLKDSTELLDDLDPPQKYRAQYKVFCSAIGEMYEASSVAYGLAANPVSATQADFNAYRDHVDKAAAYLQSSNQMLGRHYDTIETSRANNP
jgi:4-amino-4-deoxy-L-arabinose transferase-like glycosyltransferase